jgi:hypothetical protein
MSDVIPMWDRLSFKHTFHESENMLYQALKKAGVKDFAGTNEFRNPALITMDLELMKHIM